MISRTCPVIPGLIRTKSAQVGYSRLWCSEPGIRNHGLGLWITALGLSASAGMT